MSDRILLELNTLGRVVAREIYQRSNRLSNDVAAADIRHALENLEEAVDSPGHSIQLCRDSTDYGEGCPIQNCKCTCHEAGTSIGMSRVEFPR